MTLVLLVIAALAAAVPAAPVRIPGTKFSLGMAEDQLRPGDFTAVQDGGEVARQSATKFCGLPCRVKLTFRDGRLQRATFEADSVAPEDMNYVENEMRHARLWRECVRLEPANRVCDWLGAVHIHLEYQHARMAVQVTAQPDPFEDASEPVAETLESSAGMAVEPPTALAPAVPPVAMAAVPAVATGPAAEHVAVLPETLRISLPESNPPTAWPRIEVLPPLEYPAAARAAGAQGIVWVMTLVDADGSVRSAHVERGGNRELDDAARAWVAKARFAPCARDGQPCRFWVRVAVRFVP